MLDAMQETPITKQMKQHCKKARQRRMLDLENKNKDAQATEHELKRKSKIKIFFSLW